MRGLKPFLAYLKQVDPQFAPHTGAWIETAVVFDANKKVLFAPHTGAWIETTLRPRLYANRAFAPHTGAWIETDNSLIM